MREIYERRSWCKILFRSGEGLTLSEWWKSKIGSFPGNIVFSENFFEFF